MIWACGMHFFVVESRMLLKQLVRYFIEEKHFSEMILINHIIFSLLVFFLTFIFEKIKIKVSMTDNIIKNIN